MFKIEIGAALFLLPMASLAVDQNSNQQSDVWEMLFQAAALPPTGDMDADGWTNASESTAGTNPLDAASHPEMAIRFQAGLPLLEWRSLPGKRYTLLSGDDLTSLAPMGDVISGNGTEMELQLPSAIGREFFRMKIDDADTDGDGVNDWEELVLGFDPETNRTDHYAQTDSQRVTAGLIAANTVTVSVYDDTCSERWPDPAVLVLRRSGGLQPLTVNVVLRRHGDRGMPTIRLSIPGNTVDVCRRTARGIRRSDSARRCGRRRRWMRP